MATTAELGVFEYGAAEYGSIALGSTAGFGATIPETATLSGGLTTGISMAATLAAISAFGGPIITGFNLQATMGVVVTITGPLYVSRFVRRLKACGHPLITAVQDWLTK